MNLKLFIVSLLVAFITFGCVVKPPERQIIPQSAQKREALLNELTTWKIKGIIALKEEGKSQRANIYWHKLGQDQSLRITTVFGINVLSLDSKNGEHVIEVDGEKHTGKNLDQLIYRVSGLGLPLTTLENWLKAIHATSVDKLTYDPITFLPSRLETHYMGYQWLAKYSNYQQHEDFALANQITISRSGLTIKMKINQWEFD